MFSCGHGIAGLYGPARCPQTRFADPLDRKVTGTCQTAANASVAKLNSACADDHAACVHGVCQCQDNYVPLRNYTCGECVPGRFYMALFSALKQTHSAHVACDSQ